MDCLPKIVLLVAGVVDSLQKIVEAEAGVVDQFAKYFKAGVVDSSSRSSGAAVESLPKIVQ